MCGAQMLHNVIWKLYLEVLPLGGKGRKKALSGNVPHIPSLPAAKQWRPDYSTNSVSLQPPTPTF